VTLREPDAETDAHHADHVVGVTLVPKIDPATPHQGILPAKVILGRVLFQPR
jgi:hypothetical protein